MGRSDGLGRRTKGKSAIGCVLAAVTLAAAACSSSSKPSATGSATTATTSGSTAASNIPAGPIKIGAIISLSGPYAVYGQSIKIEDQIAADVINQDGGIAGHQVQLVIENDQGDPSTAVNLAQQLVSEKVVGIVYPGFPNVYTQTVPIFMKAKIPVVMVDPPDAILTGSGGVAQYPYFFDNYASTGQTMQILADAIVKKDPSVAIVTDGSLYGQGEITAFKQAASQAGLQIATTVTYSQTAIDVTTQLLQAKNSGAKAIVLLVSTGYDHIYDGLRAIGWTPDIYVTSGALADGFASIQNLASSMSMICSPLTVSSATESLGSTLDTYMAKIDQAIPGPQELHGTAPSFADDLYTFKAAIEQANSTDPDAIKAAIETWTNKALITPLMTYTYSPTNHVGITASQNAMCSVSSFGPEGFPIRLSS